MIATRALNYAGTHRPEDIAERVACGQMQEWANDDDTVVITEIRETPLAKYLHFFLAEGNMGALETMIPAILDWGRACGCTRASLVGREGWRRMPWLLQSGWRFKHIVMERSL